MINARRERRKPAWARVQLYRLEMYRIESSLETRPKGLVTKEMRSKMIGRERRTLVAL